MENGFVNSAFSKNFTSLSFVAKVSILQTV